MPTLNRPEYTYRAPRGTFSIRPTMYDMANGGAWSRAIALALRQFPAWSAADHARRAGALRRLAECANATALRLANRYWHLRRFDEPYVSGIGLPERLRSVVGTDWDRIGNASRSVYPLRMLAEVHARTARRLSRRATRSA